MNKPLDDTKQTMWDHLAFEALAIFLITGAVGAGALFIIPC